MKEKKYSKVQFKNNKFKINDRFILAIFVGTLSAFVAMIFGYLLKLIYPAAIIMQEVAILSWVNSSQTHSFLGIIFGFLCGFIAGGIHASVFIYVLDRTGWKFFWLKSFAVSTTGWLLFSIILLRILYLLPYALNDILPNILFCGQHVIYLTVSAILVNKFGVHISVKRIAAVQSPLDGGDADA